MRGRDGVDPSKYETIPSKKTRCSWGRGQKGLTGLVILLSSSEGSGSEHSKEQQRLKVLYKLRGFYHAYDKLMLSAVNSLCKVGRLYMGVWLYDLKSPCSLGLL